jgi:hypothetical protein
MFIFVFIYLDLVYAQPLLTKRCVFSKNKISVGFSDFWMKIVHKDM